MLIVDTDVVSELMRPAPEPAVVTLRERAGLPIDGFDAQIAAICRARGSALATRNVKDFRDTQIDIIDPWLSA